MRIPGAFFALPLALSAAGPDWTYISTPNFELFTTAGPKEARRTIEYFEQVRDFFMRARSSRLTTVLPVTIVAFRNSKEYKQYSPNEGTAAFYTGTRDRDYIVMSGTGVEHFPVAVHEYMHLLVRHSGLEIPVWLNEGLAEVYSTLRPAGGKVELGIVPKGRAYALARENWLPLPKLLSVVHDSPEYNEKDRAGIFYAQSWLLTHMLMLDDDFRPGFGKFLEALSQGSSSSDAFQKVFSITVPQLDRLLGGYYRSQRLNAAAFDTKLERFDGLEARAADPVEVELALASIAGLIDRRDEAIARLEVLAKQNPDRWRIHDALALACLRKGDTEAARKHFGLAAGLNPPDWRLWWDYARALVGEPGSDEAVLQALRRTVELNGLHLEARLALAEQYNYCRQYKEALATLKSITRTNAEFAPRLFLALSYAHANLNNDPEARLAAQRARQYAKDGSYAARADDILRFLDLRSQNASPAVTPVPREPAPASASSDVPVPLPRTAEQRFTVAGVFRQLDCLDSSARLHVATASGTVKLLIRDPSSIAIRGADPSVTLSCGPQESPKKVVVEYVPRDGKSTDTTGHVRTIEFN